MKQDKKYKTMAKPKWINNLIHLLKQTDWQLIIDFVEKEKDTAYKQGYQDGLLAVNEPES